MDTDRIPSYLEPDEMKTDRTHNPYEALSKNENLPTNNIQPKKEYFNENEHKPTDKPYLSIYQSKLFGEDFDPIVSKKLASDDPYMKLQQSGNDNVNNNNGDTGQNVKGIYLTTGPESNNNSKSSGIDYRYAKRGLPAIPGSSIYDMIKNEERSSLRPCKIILPIFVILLILVCLAGIICGVYFGVTKGNGNGKSYFTGAMEIVKSTTMGNNFTKSFIIYLDKCIGNNTNYINSNIRTSVPGTTMDKSSNTTLMFFFLTVNSGKVNRLELYYSISKDCFDRQYGYIRCLDPVDMDPLNLDWSKIDCTAPTPAPA